MAIVKVIGGDLTQTASYDGSALPSAGDVLEFNESTPNLTAGQATALAGINLGGLRVARNCTAAFGAPVRVEFQASKKIIIDSSSVSGGILIDGSNNVELLVRNGPSSTLARFSVEADSLTVTASVLENCALEFKGANTTIASGVVVGASADILVTGATVTTGSVRKSGKFSSSSNVTNWEVEQGAVFDLTGAATAGVVTLSGGTFNDYSSGDINQLIGYNDAVYNGLNDAVKDIAATTAAQLGRGTYRLGAQTSMSNNYAITEDEAKFIGYPGSTGTYAAP